MKPVKYQRKEIVDIYKFTGFGFPVLLKNVELMTNGAHTYPKIKLDKLRKKVLLKLARSNNALTGAQLKYIREVMGLSLREFGSLLGVAHTAVIKWESKKDKKTLMGYGTEILVKSALLIHLGCDEKSFFRNFKRNLVGGSLEEPQHQLEM